METVEAPGLVEPPVEQLSAPSDYQMGEQWYAFAEAAHFWFQWRLAVMTRLLGPGPLTGPLLEVGCGNSVARRQVEEHYGVAVDGCDVNVGVLRQDPGSHGRVYVYDIHQRRVEWDARFGTVFLLDTLEHIPEPETFLESVAYHLRPGGQLVITVPALQTLYSRYDRAVGHVKRYTKRVLARELRAGGFVLERFSYWGLLLLPVGWLRKGMVRFLPEQRVVAAGIQPSSALTDAILRGLMRTELALWPHPAIGASIVAVARKAADE